MLEHPGTRPETYTGGSDVAKATPLPHPLGSKFCGRAALTVDEVAEILDISRTSAYQACHRRVIPSRRLGRRILIPVPAFVEWLRSTDTL